MTRPLHDAPADEFPAAHAAFRFLFFAAVVLVGGSVLAFAGFHLDQAFMKWLHH
jgi:hypothetical protein